MRVFLACMVMHATVSAAGRQVAITIDDLPRGGDGGSRSLAEVRDMTARLLRPFHERGLPVTGFVNEGRQMPDLLAMFRRRGYRFVSLDQALADDAYRLPEGYAGPGGFSWIHRWSRTKGMAPKGEPDPPMWVQDAWAAR
jgi:hypothetical protein